MPLLAADIHGKLSVYEWLLDQTSPIEVLVLAGDRFDADFKDQQRLQAAEILQILHRPEAAVLYIMGNDDNMVLEHEDELIRPLHGRQIEVGDYNFVGYPYAPPFVAESFVNEDAEIRCNLVSLESLVNAETIPLTLTLSFESFDRCNSGNVGGRGLADFLQSKSVLGHIHRRIHHRFGVVGTTST
jgi:Icc-related predicted phosphoesterase